MDRMHENKKRIGGGLAQNTRWSRSQNPRHGRGRGFQPSTTNLPHNNLARYRKPNNAMGVIEAPISASFERVCPIQKPITQQRSLPALLPLPCTTLYNTNISAFTAPYLDSGSWSMLKRRRQTAKGYPPPPVGRPALCAAAYLLLETLLGRACTHQSLTGPFLPLEIRPRAGQRTSPRLRARSVSETLVGRYASLRHRPGSCSYGRKKHAFYQVCVFFSQGVKREKTSCGRVRW